MRNNYCTLYVVRHGETDWNVKGIIQGHTNSGLTENGKRQISDLSKKLSHLHFDYLFSSDLLRTKQTAEILNIERRLAVQTSKLIRERNYGKYEGTKLTIFRKMLKSLLEKYKKFRYPTTESDEEMIARVITFLREISAAYKEKKVLVVTHGGVIKILLIHLGYMTYNQLAEGGIPNGAYLILESDGVDFNIKETVGITKTYK